MLNTSRGTVTKPEALETSLCNSIISWNNNTLANVGHHHQYDALVIKREYKLIHEAI